MKKSNENILVLNDQLQKKIDDLNQSNQELSNSFNQKSIKIYFYDAFCIIVFNHSNFKVNTSFNELHSVKKSNENILMLNDQMQKKIDDFNQSNQELSNLNREYKNLGSKFEKENEEYKSMSMKFFLINDLCILVLSIQNFLSYFFF